MKIVTYRRSYYTVQKTGYGTFQATKGTAGKTERIVTHNAIIWDWLDDDSDKKLHKQALQQLAMLFYKPKKEVRK